MSVDSIARFVDRLSQPVYSSAMPDPAWQHRTDSASPAWVSRADRGELLRPHLRADGVLLVEGVAVKECVLPYTRQDGSTFRELVPLKTILDSAAGIAHLALTLHHPTEPVTRDNVGALGVGNVDSEIVVEDGGFTRVRLAVRRGDAIDDIQSGKVRELSLGYEAQVDNTPGTHAVHGAYDGIQVSRRYNHLALVDAARVGPDAAIRFDGVTTTTLRADARPQPPEARAAKGARMDPGLIACVSLLGLTRRYDTDAAAIAAIEGTLRSRKDAEEAAAEAAEEAMAAKDAEGTALQAALDEAKAALAKIQAELDALKGEVAAEADKQDRAALLPLAASLKVDAAAHPTRAGLRKAIATAHMAGKLRADRANDPVYIDAMVDIALERHDANADGRERGNQAWGTGHGGTIVITNGPGAGGGGGQSFSTTDQGTTWNADTRSDAAPRLSPIQRVKAAQAAARGAK